MIQYKPLDSTQHRSHGWKRYDHYRFAARDAWAPLLLAEIPAALAVYPFAFAAMPAGGHRLVVLQGLYEGQNLLVAPNGKWRVGYVPSHYRGYPFTLQRVVEGEKQQLVLCFDHDSGLYREHPNSFNGEQRFFDDSGQPGELVGRLLKFLKQTAVNREVTDRAVAGLEQAGLLVDWPLSVENPDPNRPLLKGLKQVDQGALGALGGKALEALKRTNALPVAYAQIFSTARLGVLIKFAELHAHNAERQGLAGPEGIESMFPQDGGGFVFDFDEYTK